MTTPGEKNPRLGTYVIKKFGDESFRAFIPSPLPPDPLVKLEALQRLLEEANQALGRLDGLASILPDPSLFIYLYVRKEAVLLHRSRAPNHHSPICFCSKARKRRESRSKTSRKYPIT